MKEIDLIIRNSKYYVICRKRKTFFYSESLRRVLREFIV